jgi:hypothetical protein
LSLAIPDKRYCFDYFRPITGIAKVIDCHANKNERHSPGTICEYVLNVVKNEKRIAWSPTDNININDFTFAYPIDDAKSEYKQSLDTEEYIDSHSWVFTRTSFELLIYDLNYLGFTNLTIKEIYDVEGCEFIVSLQKTPANNTMSSIEISTHRMELLKRINNEMVEPIQNMFLKSTSWKITKPLRGIKHMFNRIKCGKGQ